MVKLQRKTLLLTASAFVLAAATHAFAADFNISRGNLDTALDSFTQQSGVILMVPNDAIRGVRTNGIKGQYTAEKALASILRGTGFTSNRDPSGIIAIVPATPESRSEEPVTRVAEAAAPARAAAGIESVVVTSSKIKGDIQTVPIAITALSQEQLTSRQIAGGPDLVKEVPNLTFSKTNFSGYTIQIRGIGTQAISVATDPAVAVALNDIPFIRNHFFEQEFYDVNQVEVLRGPQGTLYGRNATAGVVNVISAKPTDQFEACSPPIGAITPTAAMKAWSTFPSTRINSICASPVNGPSATATRSTKTPATRWMAAICGRRRVTLGWHPLQSVQAYLVWEHFSEDDDRMRTAEAIVQNRSGPDDRGRYQCCGSCRSQRHRRRLHALTSATFSQGCLPTRHVFGRRFRGAIWFCAALCRGGLCHQAVNASIDPYASTVQSRNLRVIETQIDPRYRARNDTLEFNVDYNVTDALTFSSQTGYNNDFLWSTEDYNRFNTIAGNFPSDNRAYGNPRAKYS